MPAFSVCVQYGGGFELFLHVAVIIEDEFCFSIFFFFFPYCPFSIFSLGFTFRFQMKNIIVMKAFSLLTITSKEYTSGQYLKICLNWFKKGCLSMLVTGTSE